MKRILIKRTKRDLEGNEDLSFYRIELQYYYECFRKFFEDKEKLKYNNFEKIEIVDKNVDKMYEMWKDKQIYKK